MTVAEVAKLSETVIALLGLLLLALIERSQKARATAARAGELAQRAADLAGMMELTDRMGGKARSPLERQDVLVRYLKGQGLGHGPAYRIGGAAVLRHLPERVDDGE